MATPLGNYLSVDELKATLRITVDTFDGSLLLAINAASQQIDQYCDDQFWVAAAPTAKVFKADRAQELWPGSFSTTAGLILEFDDDDDGVFETTVPSSAWQALPTNLNQGRPYNRIELLGTIRFPGAVRGFGAYSYLSWGMDWYGGAVTTDWPVRSRRARIRVTALWGWPAIPWQVKQACQILAISHYKSKDITNGQAGVSSLATRGNFSHNTVTNSFFDPAAERLLCGLRDVVVA